MGWLRDMMILAGVCLVVAGAAQWSTPAAFVTAGVVLVAGAALWSWVLARTKRQTENRRGQR